MTYNQLQYLVSVAEEMSITRTAEQFHVSQPAVSFAIRELEKEYGIVFFERRHNEIHLTPQGLTAYQEAKKLLLHCNAFDFTLHNLHVRRNLNFALAPNISAIHLPRLYPHIRSALPEVTLEMQELSIAQMTQMLKNGELDAALFACLDERKDSSLVYVTVSQFSLSLYASPQLFFSEKDTISPEELEGIPIVLQYRGSQLNTSILKLLDRCGQEPQVFFYANQLFTIIEFIRKGLAVGFLPPEIISKNSGIRQYSMRGIDPVMPLYFVYKKGNPLANELKKVILSYFEKR